MSKAVVDGAEFRVDVFTDDWERVLSSLKKAALPRKMVVDQGEAKVDGAEFRVNVFTDHWRTVMEKMKR